MNINEQKFPIEGHDFLCFRYDGLARWGKRVAKRILKDTLKTNNITTDEYSSDTYTANLHHAQIIGVEGLIRLFFNVESEIPHKTPPLKDLSIPDLYSQIVDILSDVEILNKKCIFTSTGPHVRIKNGTKTISKAKSRFVFPAKLIIKIILAELTISSDRNRKSTKKNQWSLLSFDHVLNDPIKYIPYQFALYLINALPETPFPDNCQETRKFYFFDETSKKVDLSAPFLKDIQLTKKQMTEEKQSLEVNVFIEYIKKENTLNIVFDDEMIIDDWAGKDSLYFTVENVCFSLGLWKDSLDLILPKSSKTFFRSFIRQYYKVLSSVYTDKTILNDNTPTDSDDSLLGEIFTNLRLYPNTSKITSGKFAPSVDFLYVTKEYNTLSNFISSKISKVNEKYIKRLDKEKKITILKDSNSYDSEMQKEIYSLGKIVYQTESYIPVLNKVFNLTRNHKRIEEITNLGCRPLIFAFLEVLSIEFLFQEDYFSAMYLAENIQSFKMNIIHLDRIKAEQKKKDEESKLLVRNLRHSINNTSEAVLANLKEAIEIVNKKGADNQNTLNHLYSCNDEVAALRNTVLKFCHDIIDQDSISSLYHDSYTVGYGDKTVTIKEILFSSLFMAIKQLIKNIRFKTIREAYQKEKNISLRDDLLFNKFKDYIGLKYHRSFAELTFEELLSDKTLYKDYSSYVFKVAASSDFDNLYNVFVQKRDFNSINNFLEKYFFSDVNVELNNADLSIREASYASYLLTDMLNEVCLNTLKYSQPNSRLKVLQSIQDDYLEIKILNETNTNLKGSYGSGTGISGQQAVVRKIGGYIEKAQDPTTNQFSLTVKLPIHGLAIS